MGNTPGNVLVGVAVLSVRQPNDALAEWSTVQKFAGSYSAKLYKGGSGNAGSTHIEIIPPTGKTLTQFVADPTDYSFYYHYQAITANWIQYELRFEDPDSDAWIEITVMVHQNTLGTGAFLQKSLALTDSIGWGGVGELGASFFDFSLSDTIAEAISGPDGDAAVTDCGPWVLARVRCELWESSPERTAYVDSIEIDGVTYTVEPGGTGPAMKLSSPYVDVGYTEDGVDINYSVETEDTRVEEESFAIGRFITTQEVEIVCNMAESSLANINNAIGGSVLSGNIITLGGNTLKELNIKIVGLTPDGFIRTFFFPRVNPVGAVGMSFRRSEKTIVPVTFKALKPAVGNVGSWVDNAA